MKKLEHLQKIIISASEQSFRNVLMKISEPLDFKDAVRNVINVSHKYILSPHHDNKSNINDIVGSTAFVLCVGPEGGFVSEEVNFAIDNGCNDVYSTNVESTAYRSNASESISFDAHSLYCVFVILPCWFSFILDCE